MAGREPRGGQAGLSRGPAPPGGRNAACGAQPASIVPPTLSTVTGTSTKRTSGGEPYLAAKPESGTTVRNVPGGLSVFRIADDGKLQFVRKYDAEVANEHLFWMGIVRV